MRGTPRRRAVAGVVLAAAAAVVLSGCGPAPWALEQPTEQPSPTVSRTPSVVPQPVANDLSSGSTRRDLTAGAVSGTIDYWSTLSMDRWTASALKPVSLSLSTILEPYEGQQVGLQRASMIAVPSNATETFAPLAAQTDQSGQATGYPVLYPFSYSQTFNVGEVPEEATSVTLQFTYEFLVETTPTSGEFAKQTTTDTLEVAIFHPTED